MADRFKSCLVADCNGNSHYTAKGARGYCIKHYWALTQHGDPNGKAVRPPRKICKVDLCNNRAHARGYCASHFKRLQRHGDPLGGGIPASQKRDYLSNVVLPFAGDDCFLWPFKNTNGAGYGVIGLAGKKTYVHRIVCEAEHGPPPSPAHEAAHNCGNGHIGCVNRKHLEWKTHADNMADCLPHGTRARGERNGHARLTAEDVLTIRRLRGEMLQREIAEMFGIQPSYVSQIQSGSAWAWLTPDSV